MNKPQGQESRSGQENQSEGQSEEGRDGPNDRILQGEENPQEVVASSSVSVSLHNLYLADCATNERKLALTWA